MPKVRVEFEVPDGKYCANCDYFKYLAYGLGVCTLFGCVIPLLAPDRRPERCEQCKQAEV